MAGEWISVDCCIATKPEILELIGETNEPADVIVGRLTLFWAWASLNSGDGTVKGSPAILKAVAGGDEDFWRAVERVGWVKFTEGRIEIEGWEDRFSKAAKSRLQARRRMQKYRENDSGYAPVTQERNGGYAPVTQDRCTVQRTTVAPCNAPPSLDRGDRGDRRKEIEERRETETPQGGDSSSSSSERFWGDFRAVWEKTAGVAGLGPKTPLPAYFEATAASHDHDRLIKAVEAIPGCTYFETPVTLKQFCSPGFVDRILDGHFAARTKKRGKSQDEPRPPKEFEGDDAKRFAATLERLRSEERVR